MGLVKSPNTAPIIGAGLLFASNGAMFASLLPWYPTLMREWGLSESVFGFVVACFALGSILSSAAPAPIVRKLGPLRTVMVGTVLMATVLVAGVTTLTGGAMLAVLLLLVGFSDPIVDVAQNIVAVRVQQRAGFSVMSSLHAAWSLGAAASGALATVAVGKLSMPVHIALACVVAIVMAACGCWLVGHVDYAAAPSGQPHPQRLSTVWLVLPVVVVAISGTVVEEVANSWAALMATELAGVSIAQSGLALTVMLGSQCIGRFLGDPMINRWGRVAVARFGGVLIAIGGVLAMTATTPTQFFVGVAAAGFGCATIVPSAFTAAAHIPGLSEGAGLTVVSWLMRIGFLAASPIIGVVASATSLRIALGILLIGGLTIVMLGGRLDPQAKAVV